MIVESYSQVKDPNLETLRMIELSSTSRSRTSPMRECRYSYPFTNHYYYHQGSQTNATIGTNNNRDENHTFDNDAAVTVSTTAMCPNSGIGRDHNGIYMYGDLISKLALFRIERKEIPPQSNINNSNTNYSTNRANGNENASENA